MTTYDEALKARQLIEDPLVQKIFSDLEARYVSDWRNTATEDVQKREAAHAGVKALDDFRAKLSSVANAPAVEAFNKRNVARR